MVKLIDEGKISHNERVHLAGKVPQVVSRGVIVTSGQPVHVAIEGPLVMMSPALPKRLGVPTVELSVIFEFLFTVTYSLVFFTSALIFSLMAREASTLIWRKRILVLAIVNLGNSAKISE